MQEEYQIPEVDAPTSLFLHVQLEQAKESEEQTAVIVEEPEMDFNEETGDYFEQ